MAEEGEREGEGGRKKERDGECAVYKREGKSVRKHKRTDYYVRTTGSNYYRFS